MAELVVALFLLIVSYGLNRTRYYPIAAAFAVGALTAPSFIRVLTATEYTPETITYPLLWLALATLMGGVLFPPRGVAILGMFNLGGILLLHFLRPGITLPLVGLPLAYVAVTSILVIATAIARSHDMTQLAHEITEREQVETELRPYRHHLESLVTERTTRLEASNVQLQQEIAERKRTEEALRESQERYRSLVDESPYAIVVHQNNTLIFANPAAAHLLGAKNAEELLGKSISAIVHPDGWEATRDRIQRTLQGETGLYPTEDRYVRLDGSVVPVEVTAVAVIHQGIPALQVIALDIAERKRAEEKLIQQTEVLSLRAAQLALLNTAGKKIALILDANILFDKVVQLIHESFGYYHVGLFTIDEKQDILVMRARAGVYVDADLFPAEHQLRRSQGITGWVSRKGKPLLANDVEKEPRYVNPRPDKLKTRSELAVPIRLNEKVVGVLDVQSVEVDAFDESDATTLETLADQIAIAMDKAELFEALQRELFERTQAELRLAQQATALARSNQELEQFAYVASHDLQEPLRMITSYLELLERRYKGQLDSDASEFIAYAVDGAARMKGLITDLLAYSRVSTHGKPFELVDCNTSLGQVLADLQVAVEESKATITHDPLPTVMGDPTQLGQVFLNLVGNAIKFRGDKPPVIHICAMRQGSEWLFSVRDNGIGIDPQYAERVFVIFQRLHTREQYPGSGIGLAVCQKIVERHGGRIWLESQPGEGTMFYFTLPAALEIG